MKKKDIIKLVAYFKVYGLDLYGVKFCNINQGKNNLESYFCAKLDWSYAKLQRLVRFLASEGILNREENVEPGIKLYKLSFFHKELMNTVTEEESTILT